MNKCKGIIAFIIVFSIIINGNVCNVFATEIGNARISSVGCLEGAGTAQSPYIIKDEDDMKYMRDTINNGIDGSGDGIINGTEDSIKGISACFKLSDNIGDDGLDLGSDWVEIGSPCGSGPKNFEGVFDGNNRKIKYSSNDSPLFKHIAKYGVIKDLIIEGNINYQDSNMGQLGVIAMRNAGKIYNCTIKGKITANSNASDQFIGGVVGYNYSSGIIQKVSCDVELTVNQAAEYFYCGGIVGKNNEGEIIDVLCRTRMNVSFNNSGWKLYCGGISGWTTGGIVNAFSDMDFEEDGNVRSIEIGGSVGYMSTNGKLINSFSTGNIKTNGVSVSSTLSIGGLVGLYSGYGDHIIDNCYSKVDIDESILNPSGKYIGSIVGCLARGTVKYCYGNGTRIGRDPFEPGDLIQENNDFIPQIIVSDVSQDDKSALCEKLNSRATAQGYSQWILPETENNGYPIVEAQPITITPMYEEDDSLISIYGNSSKIFIKEENNTTVIYYEDDYGQQIRWKEIALDNTKTINVYGGFKKDCGVEYKRKSNIVMEGGKVTNIYGGSYCCDFRGASTIKIIDGEVENVYGGGVTDEDDANARVLGGTDIDIEGGTISYIDANGVDNSSSKTNDIATSLEKIIKVCGAPKIGTVGNDNSGVNIDSFADKKVLINNELNGNQNSIVLKTEDISHDRSIASLANNTYINLDAFYINGVGANQDLYKSINSEGSSYKYDIKIVDTFNARLSSESSNISINTSTTTGEGFGEKAVAKGYLWRGILYTHGNYVLPSNITIKVDGTNLIQDLDYSYNRDNGLISVFNKTIGNIEVLANGIYVPPISYIDKPTISNDKFIYNGNPQCPNIDKNAAYTVNIDAKTNVGEYTATISLKDKQTTKWRDGSIDDIEYKWSINKVDLYITANDNSIIYGDSPSAAGVEYDGFVNNEDESVLRGNLSYRYNYKRYTKVGKYSIMPTGYSSDNYNIIYKLGTLTVVPKVLSFVWQNNTEYKYDGSVKEIKASISGIVNKDSVYIEEYSNNRAKEIGKYTAKITKLSGKDSSNYTLEGGVNLSCKWSIIKSIDTSKQENKNNDKTENKNTENKGNNTTSNNKEDSNNTLTNINTELIGDNNFILKESIEGVRNDNGDIIVKLNDGTIIAAEGIFDKQIRLMVRIIKKTRKEWSWIKNVTKNMGTSLVAYDIFFVNSSGVRVNNDTNTNISIISREKNQDIEVYYVNLNGESVKLKSKKETYTIKFNMKKNGYYSLVIGEKDINLNDELDKGQNENQNKNEETNNQKEEINSSDQTNDKTDDILENDTPDDSILKDSEDDNNIYRVEYDNKKIATKKQNIRKSTEDYSWIYIVISTLIILSIIVIFLVNKRKIDKKN